MFKFVIEIALKIGFVFCVSFLLGILTLFMPTKFSILVFYQIEKKYKMGWVGQYPNPAEPIP